MVSMTPWTLARLDLFHGTGVPVRASGRGMNRLRPTVRQLPPLKPPKRPGPDQFVIAPRPLG
jgi:hypothetical protein